MLFDYLTGGSLLDRIIIIFDYLRGVIIYTFIGRLGYSMKFTLMSFLPGNNISYQLLWRNGYRTSLRSWGLWVRVPLEAIRFFFQKFVRIKLAMSSTMACESSFDKTFLTILFFFLLNFLLFFSCLMYLLGWVKLAYKKHRFLSRRAHPIFHKDSRLVQTT